MSDHQDVIDRFEIVTLQAGFTDASIELRGKDQIQAGTNQLDGVWESFIQSTHPGHILIHGTTASGRAYISERGRFEGGRSMFNHALFHDQYRRTVDGRRFAERLFEVRFFDTTPLGGSPQADLDPTAPAEAGETK